MSERQLSEGGIDFIDEPDFHHLIADTREDRVRLNDILTRSLNGQPLSVADTADLLAVTSTEGLEALFHAARTVQEKFYGRRIVLFAPLYIGSFCVNDCPYCGFRRSLRSTVRKTLTQEETVAEVRALEKLGHKRLTLVFGEHPSYTPEFIADTVRTVYAVKSDYAGEIRRVNINAAPLDREGYRTIRTTGIGTCQLFQETYHRETYAACYPPKTPKADYEYRLDGLSRAFEGGCDDLGLGALFGLYDWRFEVLGLVAHAQHLHRRYGVMPHTVNVPRLRPVHGISPDSEYLVTDDQFKRLVAILRLAMPEVGVVVTARETAAERRAVLPFGVSQLDAGAPTAAAIQRNQSQQGDLRSLDEMVRELIEENYLPSFCTACDRRGRTGESLVQPAAPDFAERFCTANALLTLAEYLADYAPESTRKNGMGRIEKYVSAIADPTRRQTVRNQLARIGQGERDLYF